MESRKILDNNYNSVEGSFVYYLHEESSFDKDSFWEYYNCISDLSQQAITIGIDRDTSKKFILLIDTYLKVFCTILILTIFAELRSFPKRSITFI